MAGTGWPAAKNLGCPSDKARADKTTPRFNEAHRRLDVDQQSASTRRCRALIVSDENSRIDIAFF
jgi:hypothetical protein